MVYRLQKTEIITEWIIQDKNIKETILDPNGSFVQDVWNEGRNCIQIGMEALNLRNFF